MGLKSRKPAINKSTSKVITADMESTRPIRALIRGLEALAVLNRRNGATVSEVTAETKLPRTTTYRLLETLSRAGYIYRDGADDRYRLTVLVRSLADGFDDEAWVTQIARPCINELCREIVWPVSLTSPSGTSMLVRDTTDHASPLAVERFSAGFRIPLLTTSSGRVYLAFCPREQRDCLLEILSRSPRAEDALARSRPEVERMLEETREQGYATATRPRRVSEESIMAVPVLIEDRVLATVAIRFSAAAVPQRIAVERFLPKLRATAQKIRQKFTDAQRDRLHAAEHATRVGGLP
jgi:IclR family mhp operon transcriptional activator